MRRAREETLQAEAEASLLRRFVAFDFHVETVKERAASGSFKDLTKTLANRSLQWELHRGRLASDVLLRLAVDCKVPSHMFRPLTGGLSVVLHIRYMSVACPLQVPSHMFRPLIGGLSIVFFRPDGTREEGVDMNGLTVEMFSQVDVT